jgi:hypothetical protein
MAYPPPYLIFWEKTKNWAGVTHYNFVSGRWVFKVEALFSIWHWSVYQMDKKGHQKFGASGDAFTSSKAKNMAETVFRLYTEK